MCDSNLLERFMKRGEWHAGFLCRATRFLGFSFLRRHCIMQKVLFKSTDKYQIFLYEKLIMVRQEVSKLGV